MRGVDGIVRRRRKTDHPDVAAAARASQRNGVLGRDELLSLGMSRNAIDHRLKNGRLFPMHRGVYLVGHTAAPPLAWETAAILACGPGALISHYSAGHLCELLSAPGRGQPRPHERPERHDVDITVVGRDPGCRPGIRLHRVEALDRSDIAQIRGLPITSPARTILDLAASFSARDLEQAVAEAYARGLVSRHGLIDVLTRYPRRRGSRQLRAIIADDTPPARTRSAAEERLLSLIRAASLPPPEANTRIGGYEVDLLWRRHRLIVEVDGFAFHSSRFNFERDHKRDAALMADGWRILRVTWRQISQQPKATIALIDQALE